MTSTVYGKLSRKFLILYLFVLYLALFHLLYKCSCKMISSVNPQWNLNLSVFPRSSSPQVVSRDTTIAFQWKTIPIRLEGSQFSRVFSHNFHNQVWTLCTLSFILSYSAFLQIINHTLKFEWGQWNGYFTNISTLLPTEQSMSNNLSPLKEECSLESYFKWRLIWFRLLVRREKFQAHSFHLYNSMASINLNFLLENSCIQKTSKPSQHTGISSHGDHWQPWHLKEPFHFHHPKFYSSENGWNLLGYFEYNINVSFYKNFLLKIYYVVECLHNK